MVIDNLKAGVLKADLYLPHFNPAYQELAEHYGCFIDPARPYHPKDKAKVERTVPVVREFFRKCKALEPQLELARANHHARTWCWETNGQKVHGTTGQKPREVFQHTEKAALKALPLRPFEMPTWKRAKVHVDQFLQFEKKTYSVPAAFVGKYLWVRASEKLIQIYHEHTLLKKYVRSTANRQYEVQDFPRNFQLMLEGREVQALLARAETIGPAFQQLLEQVLTPHAKLNYRRGLALLRLKEKFSHEQLNQAAAYAMAHRIHTPKQFQALLSPAQSSQQELPLALSAETQAFVRAPEYFIHCG